MEKHNFNGRLVAVTNQKGGVGKTTTAINIATSMAAINKKVLLIDLDPQGNASTGLGIDLDNRVPGSYEILGDSYELESAIKNTLVPGLNIIPSTVDLSAVEIELVDTNKREHMLTKMIDKIKKDYDFIIIDCPPSLGLITMNALTASNSVIIPIQCEYYALEGLGKLLNTIKGIQKVHNDNLEIEGILLTMFDSRLRLSKIKYI